MYKQHYLYFLRLKTNEKYLVRIQEHENMYKMLKKINETKFRNMIYRNSIKELDVDKILYYIEDTDNYATISDHLTML